MPKLAPYYKQFENSSIAASGAESFPSSQDDRDTRSPFRRARIVNNSIRDIDVHVNGRSSNPFFLKKGNVLDVEQEFNYLEIRNKDTSQAIGASELKVQIWGDAL